MPLYPPLVDINKLFDHKSVIRIQQDKTQELLQKEIHLRENEAVTLCEIWATRFDLEAHQPFQPERAGLTAFRVITDYITDVDHYQQVIPALNGAAPIQADDNLLETAAHAHEVIGRFLDGSEQSKKIPKQKVKVGSTLESDLLSHVDQCGQVVGGQAGNIAWFYHVTGTDPLVYSPYISEDVMAVAARWPGVDHLRFFWLANGAGCQGSFDDVPRGVIQQHNSACAGGRAPAGSSVIITNRGNRLILAFMGLRDLNIHCDAEMPFHHVQIHKGAAILAQEAYTAAHKLTWPQVGLFFECRIEDDQLLISLPDEAEMARSLQGKAEFAIIGGLDAIFYDDWMKSEAQRSALVDAAVHQLTALKQAGIEIGIEISKVPKKPFLDFLRSLCRQGIISTVGINGEDELVELAREENKKAPGDCLYTHTDIPTALQGCDVDDIENNHFEFFNYLRAVDLAQCLEVSRLYVHTTNVDLIIDRDGNEEALVKAQAACLKGKGWVMGALGYRCWGEEMYSRIEHFPPAVKPDALVRLARLVQDLEQHQGMPAADARRMRETGLWRAGQGRPYAVAAVPVLWPSDPGTLPIDLNVTGSGDMSFGAFMIGCKPTRSADG